jgi:hypothetical protein
MTPEECGTTVFGPGNIQTELDTPGGTEVIEYDVTAENCKGTALEVDCGAWPSGSTFPLGNTEVTCTAVNQFNIEGLTQFWVQVDDTTDPETLILEARDDRGSRGKVIEYGNKTGSTSLKFTFEGTDFQDVTFECSLDGAPFSPCSSPHMFSNLTGGAHVFQVRATDSSENTDDTPAIFSWTVAGNKFKNNKNH